MYISCWRGIAVSHCIVLSWCFSLMQSTLLALLRGSSNLASGGRWGIRPLVTLGISKVTRQAAQRRRHPVEDGVLVSCMAKPCQYPVAGQRRYRPLTLALSHKGRGDGYRGRLRFANRPYAKVATAPDSRYQIAPLTIDLGKGVNRRPSPYYGARVVLSMVLMS